MNKFSALKIPGMNNGTATSNANGRTGTVQPGSRPKMIDVFRSARNIKDPEHQGHATMSEKGRQTLLAATDQENENLSDKDWELLSELATRYDNYKAQEASDAKNNNNKTKKTPAAPAREAAPGDTKAIRNNLNNLFGGGGKSRGKNGKGATVTTMTSNGSFLNDAYFDQYLVEKSSGLALDYSNETALYKRFGSKGEEQRLISERFAGALLQHPRANQITQLTMNGALLPDAFLVALCEACGNRNSNSGGGLPYLQVLNLESNLLGREGVEALSKIIADRVVWKRLQILKLENQKKDVPIPAEEALGEAILHGSSLVQVGLRMKSGIAKQQVANTIQNNMDKLRVARRRDASKKGTLKARKRNEMESYFDAIANNDKSNNGKNNKPTTEVNLTGNLKFLGLNATERTKTGSAFCTNKHVTKVTMTKLKLDDDFAAAFGKALATNTTLETVSLDSNSFSGRGVIALLEGLARNTSVTNFQVRHQSKTMASSDEEVLPGLLTNNTTLLKLGTDTRNPLVQTKLDRKTNENRELLRKKRKK